MGLEATLLVEAGDSDSRHYKKSSVPQKPKGHISSFAGSDCKPIVEQPAVGLRAAVFGRRASICDTTTTMPETSSSVRRVDVNKTSDVYRTDSVNRENCPESSLEPPLQVIVNMLTALLTSKHSAGGWV
jgi:hypothetical protein